MRLVHYAHLRRGGVVAAIVVALGSSGGSQSRDDAYAWLRAYSNAPTRSVVADPRFADLARAVVPSLVYVTGSATTLAEGVTRKLGVSNAPARLRDSRYVALFGTDGFARCLLWVDLERAEVFGALGSDERVLLIFSRQLPRPLLDADQLPAAFRLELTALGWKATQPEYFAAAKGGMRMLVREPRDCAAPPASGDSRGCALGNRDAAEQDMRTAYADLEARLGRPAAGGLRNEQSGWRRAMEAQCGALPASAGAPAGLPGAGPDCRAAADRARARELALRAYPRQEEPAPGFVADPAGGFRDAAAGIRFTPPAGWSATAAADQVAIRSPDGRASIRVWTEAGRDGDQASAALAADVTARLGAARASGPPRAGEINGSPTQSLSGAATLAGATAGWRADLILARQPVVILVSGPFAALVGFADAIAAFNQSVELLP